MSLKISAINHAHRQCLSDRLAIVFQIELNNELLANQCTEHAHSLRIHEYHHTIGVQVVRRALVGSEELGGGNKRA